MTLPPPGATRHLPAEGGGIGVFPPPFRGAFLKTHEEHHRTIWLGCAAELERKVKAIKTTSCKDADRKAAQLWTAIRAACNAKHNAFDAAEQKKLMKHPFVRYVYGRKFATDTAAAAAQ